MSAPSPSPKLKAAILGATGAVGQRFVLLLSNHPWFTIAALCASERSAGRRYAECARWRLDAPMPDAVRDTHVRPCDYASVRDCDVVFSGLDASVAGDIEAALASRGLAVFSNAKNHRMHPAVPLVVPTANPEHLAPMVTAQRATRVWANAASPEEACAGGFIVTNANCSTTGIAVVLKALDSAFGELDQVAVTTMQALSGAGYPGLPSLDILDNVVPLIGGEEDKIETEPLKILGRVNSNASTRAATVQTHAKLKVSATCTRVPVLDGHTASVSVRFASRSAAERATPEAVQSALAAYAPALGHDCPSFPRPAAIHVCAEEDRPQPRLDRNRAGGMAVSVGRVRICPLFDLKLVVLAHNTVLGAAGSSILNAEMAYTQGLLGKR